ncbi:MAG: Piwi domain-containing protein [Candidatus Hodarchaeota archaeon]
MQNTHKKRTQFLLNTAHLASVWNSSWGIYEANFEDWHDEYYYETINFRRNYHIKDFILESYGRFLIVIPIQPIDLTAVKKELEKNLSEKFDQNVRLVQVPTPSPTEKVQPDILSALRNALGGYLAYKLIELDFEKISSKGTIGRFFHPTLSKSKVLSEKSSNVILRSLFEFTALLERKENSIKAHLAIDLKTEVEGWETLEELITDKGGIQEIRFWPNDHKNWFIKNLEEIPQELRKLSDHQYRLINIEKKEVGINKPLNLIRFNPFKTMTLKEFLSNQSTSIPQFKYVAVLKDKSESSSDPNTEYRLPASYLTHKIPNSSLKYKKWESEFHRFSKPPLKERYQRISVVFELLREKGLVGASRTFTGVKPQTAFPSIQGREEKIFGKPPNIIESGVDEWGKLEKILCYFTHKDEYLVQKLKEELEHQLDLISKKSGVNSPTITMMNLPKNPAKLKDLAEHYDQNREATLYLFVYRYDRNYYKRIKSMFTQENRKPVQFIRTSTLKRSRNLFPLVRTLIPQILAKTGGLPYRLSPANLDNALIIGLDKARDSSSTRPSASAGVAAVTPEGRYVSAASTPLDNTKHDSIDVDKLAEGLLDDLRGSYKDKLDYIVILRDGAPEVAQAEVEPWKRYIKDYGLEMIFLASRKENSYRVFPSEVKLDDKRPYELPIVLNESPLPSDEFLVVTADAPRGTPKPVVYTLLDNSVNFTLEEIQSKVIAQVVSMSMLCWESPKPTSQPLPLHYADKLAGFTQMVQQAWQTSNKYPMFI